MIWQFSEYAVLTALPYLLILLINTFIISDEVSTAKRVAKRTHQPPKRISPKMWLSMAVWNVIIIAALNGVVYMLSASHESSYVASDAQTAAAFGLHNDHTYPLVLGSRVSGSSTQADAHGGLFSAYASVSSQPASALSVGYTVGENSWILEIPLSKITFVKSTTATPSVVLHLTESSDNYDPNTDGATVTDHYGACQLVIHNLFTTCDKKLVSRTADLTPSLRQRGLAPLVSANLDSARLVVTPAMYRQILGN